MGRNKLKKLIMIAVGLLMMVLVSGCGSEPVGVVDMNKVMADSPKIQQMEEELQTMVKDLNDKLTQDKPNLSAEDLQKRGAEMNTQITAKQEELSKQLRDNLDQAVAEIAQQKKLGVVLYKESVFQGGTDITDDVIAKMK